MNNRFIFVILLGLLCSLSGYAQDKMGGALYKPVPSAMARSSSLSQSLSADQVNAIPMMELALPSESMRQSVLSQLSATASGVPMRVGTERLITQLDTVSKVSGFAPVQPQSDGSFRQMLKVRSPKAQSVRLALQFTDIDERSQIRIYTGDGKTQVAHTFTGGEIIDLLGKNLAANDKSDNAVTWWSPSVVGDSVILVVDMPDQRALKATQFAVSRISHIELSEKDIALIPYSAGTCNVDAVCKAGWELTADSVALIRFQSGGYSYICTGTLMNNAANNKVPYFLTANHCINTQTVASTVESRWFLQNEICGDPSQQIDSRFTTTTGGADLLYNSSGTDTSFMKLRTAPPSGAYFSGWSAVAPTLSTVITGIHHPSGDLKKISLGTINNYQNCSASSSGYFTCTTASGTTGNYINALFTEGTTEPGSSGSGLFISDTTYGEMLIGTLYGGNSSCTNPSGSNIYGRFDIPYYAALKTWLWPADTRKTVTITSAGTGTGTVSSSPSGIYCGSACSYPFALNTSVSLTASATAGSTFAGWSGACSGTGNCNLSMNADKAVTANFTANTAYGLTLSKSGNGTVTSAPSSLNCGTGCSSSVVSFAAGTVVTLTAVPDERQKFTGWGGACSGTSTCTLSMTAAQTVSATFQSIAISTLNPNTPVGSLTGATGSQVYFQFTAPSNANITSLKVTTSGGTGDADLYIRQGNLPTITNYDCKSDSPTTSESCAITSPLPGGTYYALIDGYSSYSGVTLSVQMAGTATITVTKKGSGSGTVAATNINNAQVLSLESPSDQETSRALLVKTPLNTLAQEMAGPQGSRLMAMRQAAVEQGSLPVIVGVRVPFAPEGELKQANALLQRQEIMDTQSRLTLELKAADNNLIAFKTFESIPFFALHVSPAQFDALMHSSDVISLEEDLLSETTLSNSVPQIGAPQAWGAGYTGVGRVVAVLDTGVDKNHPFIAGKVVSEACYSTTSSTATTLCPGGVTSSVASGSAMPCASGCEHGTHVSGIVAGKSSASSGVAKEAKLIAIQVFSKTATGSVSAYTSDLIRGLQRVYALQGTYAIDAVNMSLGGGSYNANCDSSQAATKAAIDNLKSVKIATVVSSGNDGITSAMSAPACISTAVSVGAVNATAGYSNTCKGWTLLGTSTVDEISCYSNSASFLSLLAPGSQINSSIPGSRFVTWDGTSMAAPHVAGAWAVYKQKYPTASVATALAAFQQTGVSILDPRNNITKPRINLSNALSLTPQDLINCGAKCSIKLNLGDQITLTSSPTGNHVFGAWSDACNGKTNTCTVQVSGDATLTATFDTLQISRAKKIIPVLMMLLDD